MVKDLALAINRDLIVVKLYNDDLILSLWIT